MKNIFILLTLISFNAFGQQPIKVEIVESRGKGADPVLVESFEKLYESQNPNYGKEVSNSINRNSNAMIYTPPSEGTAYGKTNIKVPLSVDFSDFTDLAIVDVINSAGLRQKVSYNNVHNLLLPSTLTIVNPLNDKKKFRANTLYLRENKNPKWLYFYSQTSRLANGYSISITIRDYKNTIVYSAISDNVPWRQVYTQIANF